MDEIKCNYTLFHPLFVPRSQRKECKYMFFDTHAHVNDRRFDEDRHEFIMSLKQNQICAFTEIGYDIHSSEAAIELANKYECVYAAVGVHPADVGKLDDTALSKIQQMLTRPKVVALGEIGLDYHFDDSPSRECQRYWFEAQIDVAKRNNMPIVVHSRDAMEDTINVLKSSDAHDGIIHCYSGSKESAKILLDMGFYISIAGPVTFKNALNLVEVAKYVPNDRIVIETDSPYLAPEPNRGKRNCPVYVKHVCQKIAQLRGISTQEFAQITKNNAKAVYKIKHL